MEEYKLTEEEKQERALKLKELYEAQNPKPRNRAEKREQARRNKRRE